MNGCIINIIWLATFVTATLIFCGIMVLLNVDTKTGAFISAGLGFCTSKAVKSFLQAMQERNSNNNQNKNE